MRSLFLSPPGIVVALLGGGAIAYETFQTRPESSSDQILLDAFIVIYMFITVNFLYHHRMKPIAWGIVLIPIIVLIASMVIAIMEIKQMERNVEARKRLGLDKIQPIHHE